MNQKLPYSQRVPRQVRLARTCFVLGLVIGLIGFLPHMASPGFNGGTVLILLSTIIVLVTSVWATLALEEEEGE
mgnify:FL=1